MLCYQSSRKGADVMHDTFYWLSINRTIFRAMALPIVLVVTGLLYYIYMKNGTGEDGKSLFDIIATPITHNENGYVNGLNADIYYAILAFFTSIMTVPLLYRYFEERKSLLRITTGKLADTLAQHLWRALFAALVAAIGTALMCSSNWFLMILEGLAIEMVFPFIVMWENKPFLKSAWIGKLCSGLYILLICFVIIVLPSLSMALLMLVLDLFDKIIPGIFDAESDVNSIVDMIVAWCTSIGFCISVIVFETGSIILHGTMFDVRKPQ